MQSIKTNFTALLILPSLLSMLFMGNKLFADTVYKSINEQGDITYSSSPPVNQKGTVKVDILPPPSEQSVQSAKQRHQQNLIADKTFKENRKKRAQEVADNNRIRHERTEQSNIQKMPKSEEEQGPYFGIPGHGILVLPKGPGISLK